MYPRMTTVLTGSMVFFALSIVSAPGIYWGESALLTARAWQLGVAHPPGYSICLQIIHGLQKFLPIGDIAFRSNLVSVSSMAIASGLLCFVLLKWQIPLVIASIMTLAFSLSLPVVTAVAAAEVYALHLLFLLIILALQTAENSSLKHSYLQIFIATLAVTHHLTFILFIPGLIALLAKRSLKAAQADLSRLATIALLVIIGLSGYLYLPVRESIVTQSVWGHPDRLDGFLDLITASEEAKGSFYSGLNAWKPIQSRARVLLGLLDQTLSWPGLVLALTAGIFALHKKSRQISIFICVSFVLLSISVILYDSNESASFFLPGIMMAWLWLTACIGSAAEWIRKRTNPLRAVALLIIFCFPAYLLVMNAKHTWRNRFSEVHIPRVLAAASIDSFNSDTVLISRRSDWCFIYWYMNAIEQRSNQMMVFQHLLSFNWYYRDLIDMGLMRSDLPEELFEDSQSWNAAITASLAVQNNSQRSIVIVDPELFPELETAGWKHPKPGCSLFGAVIPALPSSIHRLNPDKLYLPGRQDLLSGQAIGAFWYRYAQCCAMTGDKVLADGCKTEIRNLLRFDTDQRQ